MISILNFPSPKRKRRVLLPLAYASGSHGLQDIMLLAGSALDTLRAPDRRWVQRTDKYTWPVLPKLLNREVIRRSYKNNRLGANLMLLEGVQGLYRPPDCP
jgi:hypothetical protein